MALGSTVLTFTGSLALVVVLHCVMFISLPVLLPAAGHRVTGAVLSIPSIPSIVSSKRLSAIVDFVPCDAMHRLQRALQLLDNMAYQMCTSGAQTVTDVHPLAPSPLPLGQPP